MVTHSRDHDVDASDDAHRPPNRPSYTCSDKKGDENPRIRSCVRKKKNKTLMYGVVWTLMYFFSWKLLKQPKIYYGLWCYGLAFIILVLFCYFTIFLYYGNYMYTVFGCKNHTYCKVYIDIWIYRNVYIYCTMHISI